MPDVLKTPIFGGIILEINTNRHQWVSVAAYFKAEARDFEQGKELENWLAAEIEYKKFQIKLFLLRSQEDGGMLITSLQKLADSVGVSNPKQMSEVDLIRGIQKVTEHRSCFRISYQQKCENSESECPWREECQKLLAVWYR
ncbi:MAG: DUF2934 domain-containing protein [Methylococcaceae bacterium]